MRIGFTGDLSFSAHFRGAHADNDLMDQKIKDFFDNNDYNVVNFESPVTPCKITNKKRLAHRCEPETLGFVRDNIKNPILSYANNHMMDYGYIGLVDSLELAREWELPYIGAGLNVEEASKFVVLGDDIKVAVIAVQYKDFKIAGKRKAGPMHESKVDIIKERIKEMKAQADYIVMVYHGGDEFFHVPMPYVRKQLKKYLDWGCDIVVAHHPHVVQGYEQVGKKAIFYSLGNFIFDTNYQRAQEDTDKGVIINIDFNKDGYTFDYIATLIDRDERKLHVRDEDEHFVDINTINYSKAWAQEAYRKEDIKQRAKDLKERELEESAEAKLAEEEIINKLKKTAELSKEDGVNDEDQLFGDDPDDAKDRTKESIEENDITEDDEEERVKTPGVSFRINAYRNFRDFYKKYIKGAENRRRAAVVRWGGRKAAMFYKK